MLYATDYDYDYTLSFFSQPKLLRGIYSIFVVSLVMSVFEIIFYKVIVQPQTQNAVVRVLDNLQSDIHKKFGKKQSITDLVKNAGLGQTWVSPITILTADRYDVIGAYLETAAQRENEIIAKNNLYAYLTGSFVIFLLVLGLYITHTHLVFIERRKHTLTVFGADYGAAIITAVITVALLAAFQVLFYFFGHGFKFVGSDGFEELQNAFNNMLRTNLGMQPVTA